MRGSKGFVGGTKEGTKSKSRQVGKMNSGGSKKMMGKKSSTHEVSPSSRKSVKKGSISR